MENEIRLNWMPGHEGHRGNMVADCMAKEGARTRTYGQEPRMPVSRSLIKEVLSKWSTEEHDRYWQDRIDCRQSRLVLPNVEHQWSRRILRHSKKQIKIVTQLVTGHANLQRHRYIMGMEDNPDCRGCGDE